MRDESLSMKGSQVRTLPPKNRVWGQGRVCAQPGCITRISMYNRSNYCWSHEPVRYYISRGRKKRAEAA
jgi:hypothetical protein